MITQYFNKTTPITCLLIVCCILWLNALSVNGQADRDGVDRIPKPSEEEFTDSSELMIPWRDSNRGCNGALSRHKLPGCPDVRWPENNERVMLAIYNHDGDLWYRFNIETKNGVRPDFLRTDFKPLAPKSRRDHLSSTVILRLAGESPNWYKVEVNEETGETKYILKSDRNWAKITWSFVFSWSTTIQVDQKRNKLREKPAGEIIEEYADRYFYPIFFERLDGDWMYVEGNHHAYPGKPYYGWIRWRNGRDILVGSKLNNYKIPESKNN